MGSVRRIVLSAVAASAGAFSHLASAQQEVFWNGASDSNLASPANWNGGVTPASGALLYFSNPTPLALNNDLDPSTVFNGIRVNALSGPLTIFGNALTLRPVAEDLGDIETWHSDAISLGASSSLTISSDLFLPPLVINRTLSSDLARPYIRLDSNAALTLAGNVLANVPDGIDPPVFSSLPAGPRVEAATGSVLSISGTLRTNSGLEFAGTGTLVVSGELTASEGVTLYGHATLVFDGSGSGTFAGLNGSPLTISSGSTLRVIGNDTQAVTQHVGVLRTSPVHLDDAPLTIEMASQGQSTVLEIDALFHNPGLDFRDGPLGRLGQESRVVIATAPVLESGILRNATVNSYEFATYDTTISGTHAVGINAATTTGRLVGAGPTDNVFLNGETLPGSGIEFHSEPVQVNSLAVHSADVVGSDDVTVTSGFLLLNGENDFTPLINFGGARGQIYLSGETTLDRGLSGTAGVEVFGGGTLVMGAWGGITGDFVSHENQIRLTESDALRGMDVQVASLDIGSTTQTVRSLTTQNLTGNGAVNAETEINVVGNVAADLNASAGLVYARRGTTSGSIAAQNVHLITVTADGQLSASEDLRLGGVTVNGGIGATNRLLIVSDPIEQAGDNGNVTTLRSASTHTGLTQVQMGAQLNLEAGSSLNSTSHIEVQAGGALLSNYGGADLGGRFGANTHLLLNNSFAGFSTAPGTPASETIGVLDIGADPSFTGPQNSFLSLNNTTLTAAALAVDTANGARLFTELDPNSKLLFTHAPSQTGGVLDGVFTRKFVPNGALPTWTTYDPVNGVREAVIAAGALTTAAAGSFVRVTDGSNPQVNGATAALGGVVIDTMADVRGTGTLKAGSGILFYQNASRLAVANVELAPSAIIANTMSNSLGGNVSGTYVEKFGSGHLMIVGTTQVQDFRVFEGGLTVGFNGSLTATGTVDHVTIRDAGRVTAGSLSSATLIGPNARLTSNQVTVVNLHVGAQFDLQAGGSVGGAVLAGSSSLTVAEGASLYSLQSMGSAVSNAGSITSDVTNNGGTLVNSGSMDLNTLRNYGGTITNTSSGELHLRSGPASNSGHISTAGIMTVDSSVTLHNDGANEGTITQTGGVTTVNGRVNNDYFLEGGVLKGTGALYGDVVVGPDGEVRPGNSPGTLTFGGNLSFQTGATLSLELGDGESDHLVVLGELSFASGSEIELMLASGQTAQSLVGTSAFDLFALIVSSGGEGGSPALAGVTFSTHEANGARSMLLLDESGVVTSAAPVPLPPALLLMLSGLVGVFGARLRAIRAGRRAAMASSV